MSFRAAEGGEESAFSLVFREMQIPCCARDDSFFEFFRSLLDRRGVRDHVHVSLVTDLRPECALTGSSDLEALVDFGSRIQNFRLTHLPSVHAKVYVADERMAIVTSGNLTEGGLRGNLEYGVAFMDQAFVRTVRADMEGYARLGAEVAPQDIGPLISEFRDLHAAFRKAEASVRSRARRLFKEKLAAAHFHLLRQRSKGGSLNSIFAETILFLLSKGPLRTVELHPLIKSIHPDICDDSIDRVINGESFGKKWKHHVRNAQQFLAGCGKSLSAVIPNPDGLIVGVRNLHFLCVLAKCRSLAWLGMTPYGVFPQPAKARRENSI